jgi:hypothetical protein
VNEIQPKRYVAIFDMLGCEAATRRNVQGTKEAPYALRESLETVLGLEIEISRLNLNLSPLLPVRAVNFSDSILLFTLRGRLEDLYLILILGAEVFAKSLHACVPLRGGIAYGDFHFHSKKRLYCGVPFVEAHEIGESAQWSGIVVTSEVAAHYQKDPLRSGDEDAIMKWSVPVKEKDTCQTKKEERWVLKWPLIHRNNFNVGPPISPQLWSKAFEWLFNGTYRDWPKDIQAKYDNTVEFINAILEPGAG